jgi:hypothetical protein
MRHTLQETTTDLDRANGQRVIHIRAEDDSTAVVCTFEFQENNAVWDAPVHLTPAAEPLGNAALSDQLLSLVSCLRDSHYRRDLRL